MRRTDGTIVEIPANLNCNDRWTIRLNQNQDEAMAVCDDTSQSFLCSQLFLELAPQVFSPLSEAEFLDRWSTARRTCQAKQVAGREEGRRRRRRPKRRGTSST